MAGRRQAPKHLASHLERRGRDVHRNDTEPHLREKSGRPARPRAEIEDGGSIRRPQASEDLAEGDQQIGRVLRVVERHRDVHVDGVVALKIFLGRSGEFLDGEGREQLLDVDEVRSVRLHRRIEVRLTREGAPELLASGRGFCEGKHQRAEGPGALDGSHHAVIASSKRRPRSSGLAGRGESFVTRCCGSVPSTSTGISDEE